MGLGGQGMLPLASVPMKGFGGPLAGTELSPIGKIPKLDITGTALCICFLLETLTNQFLSSSRIITFSIP